MPAFTITAQATPTSQPAGRRPTPLRWTVARERSDQQHLRRHPRCGAYSEGGGEQCGARGHADRRPRSRVLCLHVEQ